MKIFKLPHTHLNPKTLTEYLDGHLTGTAMARVDRRLTSCATCRTELESLRITVSLLKQLPEVVSTRSFTMAMPPPQPALPQPSTLLRVPQWAYAGAASAAAVVLAVLIAADATGVLATKRFAVAQPAPEAAKLERAVTLATIQESEATESEKTAGPPVEQAVRAETAATAREALPQALVAEKNAPAPVAAAEALPADAAAAPLAARAPSPVEAGPSAPVTAEAKAGRPAQTTLAMETPESLPPQPSRGATGSVWRTFEVLAATAFVVFLFGMFIRRRWSRRGFWY